MANEIRKIPFLVPPPAKAGNGGGSATESQKQQTDLSSASVDEAARSVAQERNRKARRSGDINTQLVIEKDKLTGNYIYKTINRETGEVVQQFPREEVLRSMAVMRSLEGLIIDTKV